MFTFSFIDVNINFPTINVNNTQLVNGPLKRSLSDCGSKLLAVEVLINN